MQLCSALEGTAEGMGEPGASHYGVTPVTTILKHTHGSFHQFGTFGASSGLCAGVFLLPMLATVLEEDIAALHWSMLVMIGDLKDSTQCWRGNALI